MRISQVHSRIQSRLYNFEIPVVDPCSRTSRSHETSYRIQNFDIFGELQEIQQHFLIQGFPLYKSWYLCFKTEQHIVILAIL